MLPHFLWLLWLVADAYGSHSSSSHCWTDSFFHDFPPPDIAWSTLHLPSRIDPPLVARYLFSWLISTVPREGLHGSLQSPPFPIPDGLSTAWLVAILFLQLPSTLSSPWLQQRTRSGLLDSGGLVVGGPPSTRRFWFPSIQFTSSAMNFRTLIFPQKISKIL